MSDPMRVQCFLVVEKERREENVDGFVVTDYLRIAGIFIIEVISEN